MLADFAAQKDGLDLILLDVDRPGYLPLLERLVESDLLKIGVLAVDSTMYNGEVRQLRFSAIFERRDLPPRIFRFAATRRPMFRNLLLAAEEHPSSISTNQ